VSGYGRSSFSGPSHELGEFFSNTEQEGRGPLGHRYVVIGWVFTKYGWEEVRCLTGN
jgi:hypothetical protein